MTSFGGFVLPGGPKVNRGKAPEARTPATVNFLLTLHLIDAAHADSTPISGAHARTQLGVAAFRPPRPFTSARSSPPLFAAPFANAEIPLAD